LAKPPDLRLTSNPKTATSTSGGHISLSNSQKTTQPAFAEQQTFLGSPGCLPFTLGSYFTFMRKNLKRNEKPGFNVEAGPEN